MGMRAATHPVTQLLFSAAFLGASILLFAHYCLGC